MPARTFPDPLPEWVTSNPLRSAEVKVYHALRSQLSSRYVLFYSRPWIGTNPDGTEKDGEADFVVASADTGFVVVEVKGGGVGRVGATDEWFTIDRQNRRHHIKNPVAQASRSKHELLERVLQSPQMGGRWIGAGIAVVLPDCTGVEALEGLDTPRDHFALREQMDRLGQWICERLDRTVGERGGALGVDGVAVLERLLAQSFQLRIPLASSIDSDQAHIITVTEQQYALLDFLANHQRAAIAGAAGSGKTVLALHKAIQFAEEHRAQRVLLTCYNAPLAAALKRSCRKIPNLDVGSFHGVCLTIAHLAKLPRHLGDQTREFFADTLPNALLEAVSAHPELRYDAIIIDEGQDFADEWLDALQLCLRTDESTFWIFYDDNQRLYNRPMTLIDGMPHAPFVLRKNVRNPRPIFERLLPLLGGVAVAPLGPPGRAVEEIVAGNTAIPRRLALVITRLIEDEQIDPEDIAVLVTSNDRIGQVCSNRKFDRVDTCLADDEPRGRICVDTVRRFKGLERKVIILIDPADMARDDESLYVGISRATGHLVLLGKSMPSQPVAQD